uniref:RNase_H2-Ydr279 domain-containing protein n=1 Tax=Caenorhabditis japonica TaxID=281687 RepID=A0A8R1DSF8_CAEJA
MPPKTRKAKQENDEEIEESVEDVKPTKLPETDESFARKFVVAKENTLPSSRIIKLRHPKEGCALFRISEDCFDEILAVNDGHRSFFYGESVISDGTIHLFAPYHPVFVCLPYLQKTSEKFVEISEILIDEQFKAIEELARNQRVLKALEGVCDVKDVLDVQLFRLNNEKMMEWMRKKFDALKKELELDAHKTLLECPDAFDRHVFSFLSDYLHPSLVTSVRLHLNIPEAPVTENIDMSMKRRAPEEDEYENEKPAAKKPKESVQKKKLQAASKGTKNISSFFTKK